MEEALVKHRTPFAAGLVLAIAAGLVAHGQPGSPLTAEDLLKVTTASVLDRLGRRAQRGMHDAPGVRQCDNRSPPLRGPHVRRPVGGAAVRRRHGNGREHGGPAGPRRHPPGGVVAPPDPSWRSSSFSLGPRAPTR
ncbi:MAG: hypothetical protein MZW92_22205 [Comamonadaceae bacterium]|nr:hypothetical protein [Comamonadaceae bacterium]